jgi:cytochrome c peroxidase
MNADGRLVVEKLRQIPVYAAGFEQVYGRTPSYSDLLDALAAYTASLAGPDSPEDRFARGDTTALSQEALRGRGLFFGAAGCAACHAGPDFTDDKMHVRNVPENPAVFQEALRRISIRRFFKLFGVNGYADIKEDVGHYAISKDPGDRRAFKTPPLREVSRTAPYMHNGIFSTLEQAVAFEAPKLSSNKRRALVSYLEHLSGPAPENPEAPPLPEYALIDPPEPKPAAFPKASAQAPPGGYPPLGLLPPVPVPEDNPLTPEKIELGKFLFFDPRMSGNGDTFCGACHEPSMGWGDGSSLSLGYSGNPHWRNSQTLLNAAYFANLDWDGDKSSLEDQARSATTSNTSGNADPAMVEERLADSPRYVQMFRKAFGIGRPTFDAALKAVASFVRSVPISKGSPFDSFERGDAGALSDSALRGRRLFEGKAGCIACHNGPLASDQNFHRTGVAPHPAFLQQPLRQAALRYQHILRGVPEQIYAGASEDTGLFLVTLRDEDKGKFRTPSLRELSHTAPYMHNGTLRTLKDVVDFYDRGGGPVEDKSPLLKPLSLTPNEKEDLIAFLKSLSGPEIDVTYPDLPGDY